MVVDYKPNKPIFEDQLRVVPFQALRGAVNIAQRPNRNDTKVHHAREEAEQAKQRALDSIRGQANQALLNKLSSAYSKLLSLYESLLSKILDKLKQFLDASSSTKLFEKTFAGLTQSQKKDFLTSLGLNSNNRRSKAKSNQTGFSSIAGYSDLKIDLHRDLINPIKSPHPLMPEPVSGVLFYGPPGCGKTLMASAIAEELGAELVEFSPDIINSYTDGVLETKLGEIYRKAWNKRKPTVIFIDEAEGLLSRTQQKEYRYVYKEIATMLNLMGDKKSEGKVFTILASNKPSQIDPRVFRPGRVSSEFLVDIPRKARDIIELLRFFIGERPKTDRFDTNFGGLEAYLRVAEKNQQLKQYTVSDLKEVVRVGIKDAIADGKTELDGSEFIKPYQEFEPSISAQEIEAYCKSRRDTLTDGM